MIRLLHLVLFLAFISPVFGQFRIGFVTGIEVPQTDLNLYPSPSLGGSAHFTFSNNLTFGISYNRTYSGYHVQNPSGNNYISTILSDLSLFATYPILKSRTVSLDPFLSLGWKKISREAIEVNLGAFGKRMLTGETGNYLSTVLGLKLSTKIYGPLNIHILPALQMYNFKKGYYSFLFNGGMDVKIF